MESVDYRGNMARLVTTEKMAKQDYVVIQDLVVKEAKPGRMALRALVGRLVQEGQME